MNDTWNKFKKLNMLSIDFANNLAKQATIFANSNNQVEILVTLSMEGTDGNPLQLSDDELKEALYLCHYRTGEKISDPWIISFEENEYNRAVSYQSAAGANRKPASVERQSDKLNLRLYVSCKTPRDNGLIAVGIHVPGVGDFNTTEYGTSTKNGPRGETGSPFKNPKYVGIHLLAPINYSDPSNLKLEATNFVTLERNFMWSKRKKGDRLDYEDGKEISVTKRTVYLKPSGDISENYFLSYKIECDRIQNRMVSGDTIEWSYGDRFSCFNLLDDLMMDSCAVIGAGHFGGYQANIWLVEHCVRQGGGGSFTLQNTDYEYVCFPLIHDTECDVNSFEAKLVCYKINTPIKDVWKYNWNTVIHPAKLTVTDLYGNHGTTTITFDDQEYFDAPLIK